MKKSKRKEKRQRGREIGKQGERETGKKEKRKEGKACIIKYWLAKKILKNISKILSLFATTKLICLCANHLLAIV